MQKTLFSPKIQRLLITVSLVLIGLVGWLSYTHFFAPKEGFVDLPPTYWAYDTVMWAVDEEIITGYANGTIKPDNLVSEAEILAMLFRTFGDLPDTPTVAPEEPDEEAPAGDWAIKYYNQAIIMNWEVWGRHSRNELISRVNLAVIVSGALGYHLSEDGAIQTLLDLGIMEGKNSATVDGFGTGEVTRAEALQVMKNITEYGLTELKSRPKTPSEEPDINSEFYLKVQPLLQLSDQQGYESWSSVWAREAGIRYQGQGIIYYTYRSEATPYNQVVLYAADQAEHRQFVEDLFLEMGIPVEEDFDSIIAVAMNQTKPVNKQYGNWKLVVSRGNVPEIVQISFRK